MTKPDHVLMDQHIETLLSRDPAAVVTVTVRSWSQLLPKLTLIIGEGGFRPLYSRSVRLAALQFPWLEHQLLEPSSTNRFRGLQTRLEAVDIAEARLASALQFKLFLGMLASLIGEQLTARILESAWPVKAAQAIQKDSLS